ncbi:MAG: hypothetical protein QNK04_01090 [Myxococcota bacterium]|nr:hypothetical protein [Myxococcota bacterium]
MSAATAALLLLLSPAVALAESHEAASEPTPRKPWNQEEMTDLSGRLSRSMSDIRRAFRRDPVFRNPQTPNQRAVHNLEQTLRGLEISTRQLHNRVQGGAGFEDTLNIARNIGQLLNDADMWGRRIMTSKWMDDRIQPAMELVNQIAPYYGSGPLFDPATMQRLDRPPDHQTRQPPE